VLSVVIMFGAALLAGACATGYRAYRFAHFAVTVDALIIDSDLGCFGAYGSGTGMGRKPTITYTVEFPYAGGTHRTTVRRPCDVVPPDFGRGRGWIWIQYDRDDPDRTRVLNDDKDRRRTRNLGVALVAYGSVVLGIVAVRSRTAGHRG
jgi:hypothetical protein